MEVPSLSKLTHILKKDSFTFHQECITGLNKNTQRKQQAQINFNVQFGYVKTQISVLKVYLVAKEFSRSLISTGSFGKVYRSRLNHNNFAVKSQLITSQDRVYLDSSIDEILKEICFYQIASSLRLGLSTDLQVRCPPLR